MLLLALVVLLLLLLVLVLAKDGLVLGGGEVNRELADLRLEVVSPPGPALKVEALLGRQVQAGELDLPLLDLNGLVTLEEALGLLLLLLLLLLLGADLDPLPADTDLVGLPLDQVDGDGGVGQRVEAAVDVHEGGGDLLLLDALLHLAVELLAVLPRDAGALLVLGLGAILVEHVGVGEVPE